mgnify:CR=1 FL=1
MPVPPSQEERDAEYKRKVTDVIAAMSPEERKRHRDRGIQVAREMMAEWEALRQHLKSE